MTKSAIRYSIMPASPEAHLFEIEHHIAQPAASGQRLSLPAWIPGSYMIREFARHIVKLEASSAGRQLEVEKLDKHSWRVAPADGPLTLRYQVYAFDLSVRGAYLDTQRGFFNATSLCLCVEGQERQPCEVLLQPPSGSAYADWRIATSLPALQVDASGFGCYHATGYDELIDHPVELGRFERVGFEACGVPHEIVVSGRHRGDLERLARDVRKICEYQIRLFGEPAPFDRYVFMLYVGADIYGGLEHRASTALVANRDDLPAHGADDIADGYLSLLGLFSHEYFHSWNVKRIKPAVFAPYDLARENHTRLLWAFEGITSYYDDLTLVRCGLIDAKRYLEQLAHSLSAVERGAGRKKQTLEASSFDAWTKYYRQDENSPNAIVSYYVKGALAALALDLTIRKESGGAKSLDDVMRALWRKWLADGKGVGEREWEALACAESGLDLQPFFDRALRSTDDLPLQELLAEQGVTLEWTTASASGDRGGLANGDSQAAARAVIGAKTQGDALGVKLVSVFDGGAAQAAGLSGGDVLMALDGLRPGDLDKTLARYRPGDEVTVHAFRRDELITTTLELGRAAADTARLGLVGTAAWLNG